MVYLAFMMVVVGSVERDSQALDLIAESLQLLCSFVHCIFYGLGVVNTSEYYLCITYHTCAS